MSSNQLYDCALFKAEIRNESMYINFSSSSIANVFMQTDFFSKLLSSFLPDSNGVWQPGQRTNYEIVGWPKQFKWERVSDKTVKLQTKLRVVEAVEYSEVLEKSLQGILVRTEEEDGGSYYHFSIADADEVLEYSFNDRARVIAVLAVLYDLEPHPRSHLELNIAARHIKGQRWPLTTIEDDVEVRYYGDPSKTADVLRNEGWTREGKDAHMFVFRERINGQQQQMYKISTREQSRTQQVKRTPIKPIWRTKLFQLQNYTCRICLNDYSNDVAQLSPDHRVPVIFQADNLTDSNFDTKLMTLCRYCNQQKREFCKRIGDEYDWDTSPWAFPEKYRLESVESGIREYAKQNNLDPSKVVELLADRMQP